MGLKAGESMPLKALFYGLMLSSGNDAANVIAEHVSGSVPNFMKELNSYLKSKGIRETSFYNPHGLPHEDHKTTAYDMAMIAKESMKHPFFREVVKTVNYERPQTNKQPPSMLVQSNKLLKSGACFYRSSKVSVTLTVMSSVPGSTGEVPPPPMPIGMPLSAE